MGEVSYVLGLEGWTEGLVGQGFEYTAHAGSAGRPRTGTVSSLAGRVWCVGRRADRGTAQELRL